MPRWRDAWRKASRSMAALLLEVDIEYPSTATLIFTDAPVFDATNYQACLEYASAGVVGITKIGDVPMHGGEDQLPIAIANCRYLMQVAAGIEVDLTSGAPGQDPIGTLGGAINANSFHSCPARLYQYCSDGETMERVLIWSGYVRNLTDIAGRSISFIMSFSYMRERSPVPVHIVGGAQWNYTSMPDASKNLAIACRLGDECYIPRSMSAIVTPALAATFIKFGAQPTVIPLRLGRDMSKEDGQAKVEWFAQENPFNLATYSRSDISTAPMAYVRNDSMGTMNLMRSTIAATHERIAGVRTDRDKKLTGYLIPKAGGSVGPTGAKYGNATDGKLDSWCKLTGTQKIYFDVPQVGDQGPIVNMNGAIRLRVCTLATAPPGEADAPAGQFKAYLARPASTTLHSPFGAVDPLACDYMGWQTSRLVGGVYAHPDYNAWAGSSMQSWSFIASGTTDASDADRNLYVDAGSAGKPFRIVIEGVNASTRAYLLGVMIECDYVQDAEYQPVRAVYKVDSIRAIDVTGRAGGGNKPRSGRAIEIRMAKGSMPYEGDWHPWNQFGDWLNPRWPAVVDPDGSLLWHPGLYDSSGGFEPGTGYIRTPGAILRYLMNTYAQNDAPVAGSVDGTTFGSVVQFNKAMDYWTGLVRAGSTARLFWWLHERTSVADQLKLILEELPGFAQIGMDANGKPALLAESMSNATHETSKLYEGSGSISAHVDLRRDQNGEMIEVQYSSVDSVINEIEVHYQFNPANGNYGAVARCSATSSDDGFGNTWPETPSGLFHIAASDLAGFSQERYGGLRPAVFRLNYVWDPELAVAFGLWKLWRFWRPFATVSFVGGLQFASLQRGRKFVLPVEVTSIAKIAPQNLYKMPLYFDTQTWVCMDNVRLHRGRGGIMCKISAIESIANFAPYVTELGGGGELPEEGFSG